MNKEVQRKLITYTTILAILALSFYFIFPDFFSREGSLNNEAVKFKKNEFIFQRDNGQEIRVLLEIADSQEKRDLGLMNRRSLEEGLDGMLFVFKEDVQSGFWMKDTYIPLAIAFINKDGIIKEIIKMEAYSIEEVNKDQENKKEALVYFPQEEYRYAVEVEEDFFEKNKIKSGDKFLGLR